MTRERTLSGRPFAPGEHALRNLIQRAIIAVARMQRRRLRRTTFVGVTGSVGKTTTKDLLVLLLGPGTTSTDGNKNRLVRVAQTIVRTRRATPYCVVEVAAWRPGSIAEIGALLRPQIGVVTRIGLDHYKEFRSVEAVANEKQALISALPADGIAILNADDPHVIAMAEGFAGRVVSFGMSEEATVRAEEVTSSWPEPLRFTVNIDGASTRVRTRMHGRHSATSVLAALAAAHAVGVPLEDAVRDVAEFEPLAGRMSSVSADGITFIRDDKKASAWSLEPVLEFLADAQAARKVLVVGTISDYPGSSSPVYVRFARKALGVADEVLFVGPQAHRVRKLVDEAGGRLRVCATVREAADYLGATLREGDLVVLKGSNRADHLVRIVLTRTTGVRCWREACHRLASCEDCSLLQRPA